MYTRNIFQYISFNHTALKNQNNIKKEKPMKTMRTFTQACLIAVLMLVQAATAAEQPKVLKQISEIEQTLERRGLMLPETAVRIRDRILQLNAVSGREHGKEGDAIRLEKVMTDFTFEVIYQQWLDGAWVNDTRTVMTWDDQMEIIGFLEQDWQGGAWVNSARLISSSLKKSLSCC